MLLILVTLLAIGLSDHVRAQTDQELKESIDAYIQDIMISESMVGMTVAVVREGRPLLAEGYGMKDVTEGGVVSNETLFYLASCGKALTSALISKVLSEDGRYTFDTRVRDIWPQFTLGTGFRSEHTTIRDLLSHRTGVIDTIYGVFTGAMESREDFLSRAQYFPTTSPFRDHEAYNNLMVTIGGELAAMLSGASSWEEAMRDSLLDPLGMSQTEFIASLTPEQYEALATPHFISNGAPRQIAKEVFGPNLHPSTPSGGFATNAIDMQKWLLFLTNGGLAEDGSRVMNTSDIMRTMKETSLAKYPRTNGQPDSEIIYAETGVALGWYNGLYRGYNMATHGGYLFGYASKVTVLPDLGMAVYTNINCDDGYVNGSVQNRVLEFVFDSLLGVTTAQDNREGSIPSQALEMNIWGNHKSTELDINTLKLQSSDINVKNQQYAGTYGNFVLGNITIEYNATSGELWGYYGTLGVIQLLDVSEDNFLGIVQEPLWFSPPLEMIFASSDGQIYDQLTVPFMIPQAPPTFIRDLTMADAPPPPNDSCEEPIF